MGIILDIGAGEGVDKTVSKTIDSPSSMVDISFLETVLTLCHLKLLRLNTSILLTHFFVPPLIR